jgi:deoxyribodipyrimidine photolyase
MAARAHDNPALDVAIWAARTLDRPLFVYHALSERYPYASDRHHRFILEGARDVQAECGTRGLAYGFHLERPGHRGKHLETLASTAALVVTEDVPVAPLDAWTRRLSLGVQTPVWAVDTACTFPMRRVPSGAVDRAYRFRSATTRGRSARIEAGWP